MPFFPCAHAGHPLWKLAVKQVVVQLGAQINMQKLQNAPCLGVVYISASYADYAADVVAMLSQALPQVQHWVGCAGHSVLAGDMDYGHAGGIAAMLLYMPAQNYLVFSGLAPKVAEDFVPHFALVHGDASPANHRSGLDALMQQLQCRQMVGGMSDLQTQHAQWAWGRSVAGSMPASIGGGGVQIGGLSGVAFAADADCLSVGMQACRPQGGSYIITKMDGDVVLELDGKIALEVIGSHIKRPIACDTPQPIRNQQVPSLVAIAPPDSQIHGSCIPPHARVLRVASIDTQRQGIVLHGKARQGDALTVCEHDTHAAQLDVRRACAQIWDALTCGVAQMSTDGDTFAPAGRSICGAIYIRNRGRQSLPQAAQVDTELQIIRHALGPVPLLGFTSTYEVEGDDLQHLSAQLLVFTQPLPSLS